MSANRRSSPWWMAFGCRWGGRPPVGFRVGFAVLQLLLSISSLCFCRNHWWTRKCIKPRFSQSGFCLWVATNRSMRNHSIRRFGSLRQAAAAKPWTKARARRSFAWRVSYRSLAGWLCLTGFANSRLIIKNLLSGLAKHNHCNPFIPIVHRENWEGGQSLDFQIPFENRIYRFHLSMLSDFQYAATCEATSPDIFQQQNGESPAILLSFSACWRKVA